MKHLAQFEATFTESVSSRENAHYITNDERIQIVYILLLTTTTNANIMKQKKKSKNGNLRNKVK